MSGVDIAARASRNVLLVKKFESDRVRRLRVAIRVRGDVSYAGGSHSVDAGASTLEA